MKRFIYLLLLPMLAVSCSDGNSHELYEFEPKHTIDLTGQSGDFDIIDRIEKVCILNLKVDEESWIHLRYPRMAVSDNGYYFLSDRTFFLVGYDRSGNLKFSKQVKGRGRGEIMDVGNMFMKNDTIMIYDRVLGRLLGFSEDGTFRSFLNRSEVKAEKFYSTNGRFWGLSVFGRNEFDNHYCVKYDDEGTALDNYLYMPTHLIGFDATAGYTDMSYLYHDTLRFMVMHDNNIFSLTENGVESSFRFVSDNDIPEDFFKGKTGPEMMDLQFYSQFVSEGFACFFSELAETDRYIMVAFDLHKKNRIILYDKIQGTRGFLPRPESFFDESIVPQLNTRNIWEYILFSSVRLCAYDNSVYCCAPYSIYRILSGTESLHDEKIKAFYSELKQYVKTQNLSDDDVIFVRLDLL